MSQLVGADCGYLAGMVEPFASNALLAESWRFVPSAPLRFRGDLYADDQALLIDGIAWLTFGIRSERKVWSYPNWWTWRFAAGSYSETFSYSVTPWREESARNVRYFAPDLTTLEVLSSPNAAIGYALAFSPSGSDCSNVGGSIYAGAHWRIGDSSLSLNPLGVMTGLQFNCAGFAEVNWKFRALLSADDFGLSAGPVIERIFLGSGGEFDFLRYARSDFLGAQVQVEPFRHLGFGAWRGAVLTAEILRSVAEAGEKPFVPVPGGTVFVASLRVNF